MEVRQYAKRKKAPAILTSRPLKLHPNRSAQRWARTLADMRKGRQKPVGFACWAVVARNELGDPRALQFRYLTQHEAEARARALALRRPGAEFIVMRGLFQEVAQHCEAPPV